MSAYNLLIATPDSILYQADVKTAVFCGVDGFFEVLANHAPLIVMVKEGHVRITDIHDQQQLIEVGEGFFEFHDNKGVLLATLNPNKVS